MTTVNDDDTSKGVNNELDTDEMLMAEKNEYGTQTQQPQHPSDKYMISPDSIIFEHYNTTHDDDDDDDDDNIDGVVENDKKKEGKDSDSLVRRCILLGQYFLVLMLQKLTNLAALYPKSCIILVISATVGIMLIGLVTNFSLEVGTHALYTPENSKSYWHKEYLDNFSGFPEVPSTLRLLIHSNGDNILSKKGIELVFDAIDVLRNTEHYEDICGAHADADAVDSNNNDDDDYNTEEEDHRDGGFVAVDNNNNNNNNSNTNCRIISVTNFWNDDIQLFKEQVQSDHDVVLAVSAPNYPNGDPVILPTILSKSEKVLNIITSEAQAYTISFESPKTGNNVIFEMAAVQNLLKLRNQIMEENIIIASNNNHNDDPPPALQLEVMSGRSLEDESTRAIMKDIPLIPLVFIMMSVFVCIVFRKNDIVQSRKLLGVGAVATILLSIATAYGLMFIIGVPVTMVTQLLPFVIFGIGLDDTFIIYNAYIRTSNDKNHNHNKKPSLSPAERVAVVIKDVGLSLMMTTSTTSLAFALGSLSRIPSLRWFSCYAFTCVVIDFLYQVTFFIAVLVIDERRVEDNRIDCCFCYYASPSTPPQQQQSSLLSSSLSKNNTDDKHSSDEEYHGIETTTEDNRRRLSTDNTTIVENGEHDATTIDIKRGGGTNEDENDNYDDASVEEEFVEKCMGWYADQLSKPIVKSIVLVVAVVFFW